MENPVDLTQQSACTQIDIAGVVANKIAAAYLFDEYRQRVANNTRESHDNDLAIFASYLRIMGVIISSDLPTAPSAWSGITWGLIAGFVQFQIQEGYAISTVNRRLSTIKRYALLACQAGYISDAERIRIETVHGYAHKHGKHIDEQRDVTRKGPKKGHITEITDDQADILKRQPDTLQGRRDAFIMCLLIDHGLRVGEIALLEVEHFNLRTRTFTFHRPKVDKVQKHKMSADTYFAATAYLYQGGPKTGPLWYAVNKNGTIRETVNR